MAVDTDMEITEATVVVKSTYEEAVKYLLDIPKFTKNKNNDNLRRILNVMGNPDRSFKVIHVAGTNGKGSTCAFMNSIIKTAGYKVGMFTSPHLVRVNERININGQNVSDEAFLEAYIAARQAVEVVINEGGEHPSFFEYMFLVGMAAFARAGVEFVILETGLGGRLDATNIVEKPVVSVITSVSKDHMEILGDTIEQIASEKAGIIKAGVPVVYWAEDEAVRKVLEHTALEKGVKYTALSRKDIKKITKTNNSIDFCLVNSYDKCGCLTVPFVMDYQMWNASLAVTALSEALPELDISAIREGLMAARWPGRMEQIAERVYLDGAHNYDGVLQFRDYVNELVSDKKAGVYILFSVVKEKEYHEMMELIGQIENCKGFLVAPIANARATAVEELKSNLEKTGKKVYAFDSLADAFDFGLKLRKSTDYLFCVGSLYMVGEIKKALEQNQG